MTELLGRDGVLEEVEGRPVTVQRSPRQRGIRQGAKLMFLSGVLLPVAFGLCFLADSAGPLLIPLTVFLAGLFWLLYFRLFGEEELPQTRLSPPARLGSASPKSALPPSPGFPVADTGPARPEMAERFEPRGVTEGTTDLLENK